LFGSYGMCSPIVEAFAKLGSRSAIERWAVINKGPLVAVGDFGRIGPLQSPLRPFTKNLFESLPSLIVFIRAAIEHKAPFVVLGRCRDFRNNALWWPQLHLCLICNTTGVAFVGREWKPWD
jgi:hypothetical protein